MSSDLETSLPEAQGHQLRGLRSVRSESTRSSQGNVKPASASSGLTDFQRPHRSSETSYSDNRVLSIHSWPIS